MYLSYFSAYKLQEHGKYHGIPITNTAEGKYIRLKIVYQCTISRKSSSNLCRLKDI